MKMDRSHMYTACYIYNRTKTCNLIWSSKSKLCTKKQGIRNMVRTILKQASTLTVAQGYQFFSRTTNFFQLGKAPGYLIFYECLIL